MNLFRKTLLASSLLTLAGIAQAEISANVGMVSDYKFRGVSQTDNNIALQGGFDYEHDSGLYLGTWMSNVDSNFFGGPTDPQLEMDFYVGYAGEYNDFGYDLSLVRFQYGGCSDCNTTELYLSGSYNIFTATFAYTPEIGYLGDTSSDGAWYLSLGAETEFAPGWSVHGSIGYSGGEFFDNLGPGVPSNYMDYKVGVATSFQGVDLDLSWIDVDSDGDEIFGNSDALTDGRLLLSVSKSF